MRLEREWANLPPRQELVGGGKERTRSLSLPYRTVGSQARAQHVRKEEKGRKGAAALRCAPSETKSKS